MVGGLHFILYADWLDAGTEFPYAPGHATWIVQAIKAKEKGKLTAPLVGYEPGEIVVALGDLVGNSRQAGVTIGNAVAAGWFKSHTDIVVEVDTAGGRFHTIGGNVGQSRVEKDLALKPSGEIASGSGLMVHIQNQITGIPRSRPLLLPRPLTSRCSRPAPPRRRPARRAWPTRSAARCGSAPAARSRPRPARLP